MTNRAQHASPKQPAQARRKRKKEMKRAQKKAAKKAVKKERKRARKRDRRANGKRVSSKALFIASIAIVLVIFAVFASVIKPAFAEPAISIIQPAINKTEATVDRMLAMGGFAPVFNTAEETARESSAASAEGQSASKAAQAGSAGGATPSESANSANGTGETADAKTETEEHAAAKPNAANQSAGARCYLIAQCQSVDIYSPIMQKDITGILFHQASYEWAQVMTTELPEADLAEIYDGKTCLHANNAQAEGTWADAEVAHLYRETDGTPMDTSVDCGARAGTAVFAPVTGTVLAVMDYDLYDEIPDVQIHIRPDANSDLDVVLLHQCDAQVSAGDHVIAGQTHISTVRDIANDLTDVQLGFYTEGNDPGNHSHVQVNDLNNKDYLKKYFDGKRPDR